MNPSELRDHPVFICGHPKSGTSLLRALLDSHPQLIVYPEETLFFRRFIPTAREIDLNEQIKLAEKQLIHIFHWNAKKPTREQESFPGRDYSSIPFDEVQKQMVFNISKDYRHIGDILGLAVLAYGEVSGQISDQTQAWVEKSPYNEYYAREIFYWWPEARCIHILRDPRDNFASYRRKHPSWSAEFFASNWLRSTLAGISNETQYGPDRYLILRYEDLTQTPEETLEKLRRFLGIEWDPAFLTPSRAGDAWQGNSMFANRFKEISAAPVDRWKKLLSPVDSAVIELITNQYLTKFCYASAQGTERHPGNILTARWRLFTWPLRRFIYSQINGS